ncbi:hypothetical protein F5884DRAFT_406161 [Xylogone sp. PMI_703]|nr:hypothetical protein F5884DRAFT_406161 [Xylogone sp. PMI_703]
MLSPKLKSIFVSSIPFGMTFGAFCMILMCGLSGIGNNIIGPIFIVETKDLNMPPSASTTTNVNNITAASLQLANKYSFYIWTYSSTTDDKTNYSSSRFDYISEINIPTSTIDGITVEVPHSLVNLRGNLRDLVRLAEVFFIISVINCLLILILGIAASFKLKFRPLIIYLLTGIALFTSVIFAADITAAGATVTSNLKTLKKFGVNSKFEISMVAIAWIAVVHIMVVLTMWLLMGFGRMKMNSAVRWKFPTKSSESRRSRAGLSV